MMTSLEPQSAGRWGNAIVNFSETWAGPHYRGLAAFLQADSRRSSVNRTTETPGLTFVAVKSLDKDTLSDTVHYNCLTGAGGFLSRSMPDDSSAELVFLKGMPSAQWVQEIGGRYRVHPEYFRRHLEFLQLLEYKNYHDLPPLPSSIQISLQLRLTTICTRQVAIPRLDISESRKRGIELVKEHQLLLSRPGTVSESIIRKYSVHDENTFTIEQNISVGITNIPPGAKLKIGTWSALIWLDSGKPLRDCNTISPWRDKDALRDNGWSTCFPVIQHLPTVSLKPNYAFGTQGIPDTGQSAAMIPEVYGTSLDARLMRLDAMYALSELFALVVASENQFLNFMSTRISNTMRTYKGIEKMALDTLIHSKELLDEHLGHSHQLLDLLEGKVDPKWPRAKEKSDKLAVEETISSLATDLKRILDQLKDLGCRSIEGTTIIMNDSMLEESKKSIQQQQSVNRLTLLAFFFLPVSLVTSFFGMNFRELGNTGELSIWISFATLVPIVCISVLICFWDVIAQKLHNPRRKKS